MLIEIGCESSNASGEVKYKSKTILDTDSKKFWLAIG